MSSSPDGGSGARLPGAAAAAALAVAREHGLRSTDPVVLRDLSNLILHLRPAPVVARVATTTGAARGGARAWLERDLALATWLDSRGAPVVPPASELPPGPHERNGFAITFWHFTAHEAGRRAGAVDVGRALRSLHEVLSGYPGELPTVDDVAAEAAGLVERSEALSAEEARWLGGAFDSVREALAAADGSARALHGDAHAGNLLITPSGLVWSDLEDCCRGSVGWDLACMACSRDARADPSWFGAALEAYGDAGRLDAELAPFVRARSLQLAAWTAFMAGRHPELRPHVGERLRELRAEA